MHSGVQVLSKHSVVRTGQHGMVRVQRKHGELCAHDDHDGHRDAKMLLLEVLLLHKLTWHHRIGGLEWPIAPVSLRKCKGVPQQLQGLARSREEPESDN